MRPVRIGRWFSVRDMNACDYDVIIIGGAFSGAASGILLKRRRPEARVLIVEPRTEFDRKVGESTSDVAGCFLTRVLRQHTWLVRHQLPKQGLRFWFTTPENASVERCGEIGSYFQVRLPTFQLDRATLDEHLLDEARAAGCEVWRPAKVRGATLGGIGENAVEIERDGTRTTVTGKWVIDASGKAAFLGRKFGSIKPLEEHPTNSMWVRFRNVRDLDGYEAGMAFGECRDVLPTARMMATNHLSGRGWWCWLIPLKDGDVSAGITWDTRLFTPPEGGTIGERLKAHLLTHPVGKLMFENAEPLENDARHYSQVGYFNEQVIGEGWATVGDASGFMDPLYSHGLDFCAHTTYTIHALVAKSLGGGDVAKDIKAYAKNYRTSYRRWFGALYKNKYEYLGDYDLMWPAFLLDLSTYFIGPVRLVYDYTDREFARLPYFGPGGAFFAWWMGLYNRRFATLARKRLADGTYGMHNLDRRYLVKQGFSPDTKVLKLMRLGLWLWLKLEVKALFGRPKPMTPAMVEKSPLKTKQPDAEPAVAPAPAPPAPAGELVPNPMMKAAESA